MSTTPAPRRAPAIAWVLGLDAVLAAGLVTALLGGLAAVLFAGVVLAVILGSVWRRQDGWLRRLDRRLLGTPLGQNLTLLVSSLLLLLGGLELAARALTGLGVVEHYTAMRTMVPEGTEDWRAAHITADRHREADPLLWWRPKPREPYNEQRFKGPLANVPKPAGVFRLMTYGDSNTDGPARGGWPQRLQEVLRERHVEEAGIEVLNAGVAGYSSLQGLRRFRAEVARYEPDVVLVSFGWNDLATPLGAPDSAWEPPSRIAIAAERLLLRFRFYLVARYYLGQRAVATPAAPDGPLRRSATAGPSPERHRVPLNDYVANLRGFVAAARDHGVVAVLLTRPHRAAVAVLDRARGWRRGVPRYNRALIGLGGELGTPVIDVQARFEGQVEDFVDECHFTADGHLVMARFVADRLAEAGLLATLQHPRGGRRSSPGGSGD